jgi:hypothetical protein
VIVDAGGHLGLRPDKLLPSHDQEPRLEY